MGLTIAYGLKSKTRSDKRAGELVAKMRELARDLPFEQVGDIISLTGDECDFNRMDTESPLRWMCIQAGKFVHCPWNPLQSMSVSPTRLIAFEVWPGPGSEPANIGLCQYPAAIEWDYRPADDQRFYSVCKRDGREWSELDYDKWFRFKRRNPDLALRAVEDVLETRQVKTKLAGWLWGSFCKTQYASEPDCGGIPNFLRCHISTITLLERIGKLPTIQLDLNDEGKYGPATYSDDWQEARAAGREATYVDHPGQYDAKALAAEVGDWNTMIAAYTGALSDAVGAAGMSIEAPIKAYPNFEQLEFQGQNNEQLVPFLTAMAAMAKATAKPE